MTFQIAICVTDRCSVVKQFMKVVQQLVFGFDSAVRVSSRRTQRRITGVCKRANTPYGNRIRFVIALRKEGFAAQTPVRVAVGGDIADIQP